MAEDDDIARLLREVDAATGGGSPAKPNPAAQPPAVRSGSAEVATTDGGPSTIKHLLIAGGAGAIVAFLAFGILPFISRFGVLSLAMAGFVGGAVGYGTTRFLRRDQD